MGSRHNIKKSLSTFTVRECEDAEYRDIAESNMADSTSVRKVLDGPHKRLVESASSVTALSRWGVQPLYVIVGKNERDAAVRILLKIGIDVIAGVVDAGVVSDAGLNAQSYPEKSPQNMAEQVANGEVRFVDVRNQSEWNEGYVPQAEHHFLGKLQKEATSLETDRPILTLCRTGVRSVIAASILQANEIKNVINLEGGFSRWESEGLPVEKPEPAMSS